MNTNQRTQLITALIGFAGVVTVAVIGLLPLVLKTGAPEQPVLSVPPQPEPKKLVAVPVVGTAVEFQIFTENFEETRPGWDFDKNDYLKDGRLHIDFETVNGEVHSFLNGYYQIGRGAFAMFAKLRYESGPDWTYGIVLRAVGAQTFLYLSFRKSGQFRVSKYTDGHWDDLTEWRSLPQGAGDKTRFGVSNVALNSDDVADEIGAVDARAKFEKLYVYADGQKIAEVPDFLNGFGLQFGVFSTLNVHASFDDIEVYDNSYATERTLPGSCTIFGGSEHCPGTP